MYRWDFVAGRIGRRRNIGLRKKEKEISERQQRSGNQTQRK